jgi:ABC-type sugar transport system ATPase subunit
MDKVILDIQHVTKKFMGTVALRDVSMRLYHHEILGILGENGAGKSTLMKILSGVYPVNEYEGVISIDSGADAMTPCQFANPIDSQEAGISMIYQELNLELDLTVAENIMLGRPPKTKLGLIDWKTMAEIGQKQLTRLNSSIDVKAKVRALPPSMQQIVSIARALVSSPKILILDEPTSMLTEKETENLMGILRRLRDEEGISCLYISHKLDEVFELCDRITVLRDGKNRSTWEQKDGYDGQKIVEDVIGREIGAMYPNMQHEIGEEVFRVEHFKVPHPFAYGHSIIHDVSFNLHKGEILGLAGLVGAGRSELLGAVFGSIPKRAGRVFIKGSEAFIKEPIDAKKYGLGMLTEDRKKNGYIPRMSICENITITILQKLLGGLLIDHKKEVAVAKDYFAKLAIKAPSINTIIMQLSGGNQQKVILAKWLAAQPDILFLDEPTRGIDVGTKQEIYKLILQLAKEGISIVMISSELAELVAVCDRFVVLSKGVVQAEMQRGEADEVSIMRAASNV